MNKEDIRQFFDQCAPNWDDDMIKNDHIIQRILDNANIKENIDVLDVACGTGVLFSDYLQRNVKSLFAIDLSEEMVKIAKSKYPDVNVICGDVEETEFDHIFDVINIYNAFPHFPDPSRLIEKLQRYIKAGGRLSVAHGMSKEKLRLHHLRAKHVSIELLDEHELADLMRPYFDIDVIISNDEMYQVVGIKKDMCSL